MPAVPVLQAKTKFGKGSTEKKPMDADAVASAVKKETTQRKAADNTSSTAALNTNAAKPILQLKEEQLAQGKEDNGGMAVSPYKPVQAKENTSATETVQRFASAPPAQNDTGLPGGLRSGIEQLSGFSMGDVKVNYNSDKPAQLQAHAYAQGTDIHIAPGQEKHLPHEAWHVVQQKQSRVKPTLQMKTIATGNGVVQRNPDDNNGGTVTVHTDEEEKRPAREPDLRRMGNARVAPMPQEASSGASSAPPLVRMNGWVGDTKGDSTPQGAGPSVRAPRIHPETKEAPRGGSGGQPAIGPEITLPGYAGPPSARPDLVPMSLGPGAGINDPRRRGLLPARDPEIKIEQKPLVPDGKPKEAKEGLPNNLYAHPVRPVESKGEEDDDDDDDDDDSYEDDDVFLNEASTDKKDVDRRTKSRKEGQKQSKEHKTKLGDFKSGFVKKMRTKMVDIVKDIQEKHGQMEQADNYINGDAGVNAYFVQEANLRKGKDKELSELTTFAKGVMQENYFKKVTTGGVLDVPKLTVYLDDSKDNVTGSKDRLEKTSADKAVVEMYYNQMASLQVKNDEKNADVSIFNEVDDKMGRYEEKLKFRAESEELFQYGYIRQQDVKERFEVQKKLRTKLEGEDRISTTIRRAAEATKFAIYNAIGRTLTAGIAGVKKNRDKRGWVSGVDFTMQEDGSVKREGTGRGGKETSWNVVTLYHDFVNAKDEFNAKWEQRLPMGRYAGISLVLDVFKKFIDAIQGMFSSLSLIMTGVSAAFPIAAPVLAPAIAFCASMALVIGVAKGMLSALMLMFNAIAQLENDNPKLFAELSGETSKAALNTVTDGLGIAAGAGWGASGLAGGGKNIGDKMNFMSDAYKAGPSIGSTDWLAAKGASAGAAVSSNVVPKVTNAAVSAGVSSVDNNDMTYNPNVNENRKIGKGAHAAKGDLVDNKEKEFIKRAAATTKEKAKAKSKEFSVSLAKFVPPPVVPPVAGVEAEKNEGMGRLSQVGNESKQNAARVADLLARPDEKRG